MIPNQNNFWYTIFMCCQILGFFPQSTSLICHHGMERILQYLLRVPRLCYLVIPENKLWHSKHSASNWWYMTELGFLVPLIMITVRFHYFVYTELTAWVKHITTFTFIRLHSKLYSSCVFQLACLNYTTIRWQKINTQAMHYQEINVGQSLCTIGYFLILIFRGPPFISQMWWA